MVYTHENITLDVSHINPDYVERKGETYIYVTAKFVAELLEDCCTFCEFFKYSGDCYELYEQYEKDDDRLIQHYNDLDDSEIQIDQPDAIIAIYEFLLFDGREMNIRVETENVSWVIHDVLHAIHDAAGCTIYVNSDIEAKRIKKSLKTTKKLFKYALPSYQFLTELEDEFYERFKQRLDLSKFYPKGW